MSSPNEDCFGGLDIQPDLCYSAGSMSLKDEIKAITGNKRKFLLLRIVDMDTQTARQVVGITQGTYNGWLSDPEFTALYRRREEFSGEYKQEAIQLLRRDNQLAAVLLESKLINKMKAEIESGEYELIRTNLAKEVYSKLISDLDVVPQVQIKSWQQRIGQVLIGDRPQITEGEVIDGKVVVETTGSQTQEHQESFPPPQGE